MKKIEIDDELYQYIASRTQAIGESASDILRRLLRLPASPQPFALVQENMLQENALKEPKTAKKKADPLELTVQKLEKLLKSDEFIHQTKNVARFTMLLSLLYKGNPTLFAQAVEQIHGNERLYFAKEESAILAKGSGVKAKQIPDTPYWVNTNNNTARKGLILVQVMQSMAIPQHLIDKIQVLFN